MFYKKSVIKNVRKCFYAVENVRFSALILIVECVSVFSLRKFWCKPFKKSSISCYQACQPYLSLNFYFVVKNSKSVIGENIPSKYYKYVIEINGFP